ncbi:MAG: hypothetical protein HDT28_06680 [Clostridiales bacterium]|nr:hypothetical protein [Clostridiales bacterium]
MEFISQVSASVASDIIIAVFLSLLTLLSIGALITFLCKFAQDEGELKRKAIIFPVIFGIGFAFRMVFAMCVRGYRDDYAIFSTMFDNLRVHGLGEYYGGDAGQVLYPVVYFIYLIFGGLSNAIGLSDYALGMQFMIKLPMIIAELLTAFAVYLVGKRYFNARVAVVLCSFVCVCPIFFMGVIWSTPLVFTVMFAAFGCYFLARKKYMLTIAFMMLAAFSSKEGIFLFPVACVFSIFHFVKAIGNIKRDKVGGKDIFGADYRAAIFVPVGFIISLIGIYLIGLFMISAHSYNPFVYIYEFLLAPLVNWEYFTYNGLSVYAIFNQNGSVPGARFPAWVFTCVFGAIIFAVVCVVYFTKRNRATMVMLAAYSLFTLQIYYPGSHAIGFTCVFGVLIVSYALVRDKRLLYVLALSGLCYVVNGITVMACAGYLNNLADFNFGTQELLLTGGMSAVTITCSVLTFISHLYFTVVAVSVGMTGQKKTLGFADGVGASLKEFFKIKKV